MDEDVGRTGSPATCGLRVLQPDDGDPLRGWEQGQTCYTCASPLVSYKEAKQWRNIEKEEESEGDLLTAAGGAGGEASSLKSQCFCSTVTPQDEQEEREGRQLNVRRLTACQFNGIKHSSGKMSVRKVRQSAELVSVLSGCEQNSL